MKNNTLLLLTLIISIVTPLSSYGSKYQPPTKVIESFEKGIPSGLSVVGGEISIDSLRYKYGSKSLRWDWKGHSTLTFNTPIGYRKQRLTSNSDVASNNHGGSENNPILEEPKSLFMWIYNTKATNQRIRVQFGTDDEINCEFDFNLNFKGWRTVALSYDRGDMRGTAVEGMNRMVINSPMTGGGTFYFDVLGLAVPMNPRTVNPNPQLPEIDAHPRLVSQYPHLMMEHDKKKPTLNLKPLTDKTVSDFRTVENHIYDLWFPPYEKARWTDKKFSSVKAKYDNFNIVRDGDNIYGKPLVKANIYSEYFAELDIPKAEYMDGIMRWRQEFCYTLLDIAELYNFSKSDKNRDLLETMFIDLFDYGVDQGFDYGAGLGWIHHYSYIIREYAPAMFLMRDVLEKNNRLDKAEQICRWFYTFGQVYDEDVVAGYKGRKGINADESQGLLLQRLMTALLAKDSPEKARDIKHYSSYFSNVSSAYANALDETFKPDGTFFHHAGHTFGYGGRAIYGAAVTMYALSGTEFAASKEAYNRLKKTAKVFHSSLFTSNQMIPKTFASIRFENYILPEHIYTLPAILACAGDSFDPDMASLYSSLTKGKLSGNSEYQFWQNKIDAKGRYDIEHNNTTAKVLPYSSVAMKRENNNWMATVRGHSKYVYPFESWGPSFFAFPLFIANGTINISYPNSVDSSTPDKGTWYSGYNWHRWPGSTTINLPYDKMKTDPGQVRDEGGEYLFSDQAFSGGVASTDGAVAYGFQFKGHDKFEIEGFTGRKSYFLFNNNIICIGTDIRSDLKDYDLETTLFQTSFDQGSKISINSSEQISEIGFQNNLSNRSNNWIVDNRGTGYYIPKNRDNSSLNIHIKEQVNPDHNDKGESKGVFASAWFNHGKAPSNGSYQYVMAIDTDSKKMEQLSKDMESSRAPYIVVKADSIAHIVKSVADNRTAYVVYNESGADLKKGLVKAVNKQSTFITRESGGKIYLAVSDPDLNIYDGQDDLLPDGTRCELSIYEREWFFWPSRESKVQITLKGGWKIEQQIVEMETSSIKNATVISSNSKETTIEFTCKDGLTSEISLSRK